MICKKKQLIGTRSLGHPSCDRRFPLLHSKNDPQKRGMKEFPFLIRFLLGLFSVIVVF